MKRTLPHAKKPKPSRWRDFRNASGAGFTLIEIMVTIAIMGLTIGLVLANYGQAKNASILHRETSLLMGRIRLAQEETSAGMNLNYCYHYTGTKCTKNSDCPDSAQGRTCLICPPGQASCTISNPPYLDYPGVVFVNNVTPPGGYALTLSCAANPPTAQALGYLSDRLLSYPFFTNGHFQYRLAADRATCTNGTNCYPPYYESFPYFYDPPFKPDGIISTFYYSGPKGDTIQDTYSVDPAITIKDLRITSKNYDVTCASPSHSPWAGHSVPKLSVSTPFGTFPGIGDGINPARVPVDYPLQADIRFLPPDGRNVQLNDNVYQVPPMNDGSYMPDPANPWTQAQILLGVKNSTSDCEKVIVTTAGVVVKLPDTDCNLLTTQ